jgi:hypothetical protein
VSFPRNLLWARTGPRTDQPERGAVRLGLATAAPGATLVGALVERYQFFVASVVPRMPGGFRR